MSLICIFSYVCVFLRTSHWLHLCAAPPRSSRFTCSVYWPVTRSHVTAAVFQTWARFCDTFTPYFVDWRSTVLWVLERRRYRAVCAVRDRLETRGESGSESSSDTTGEVLVLVRWVFLLFFATPWPCCELSERCADHIQFKYWLLGRLTPGITDRSLPVLRRQQYALSRSSTTPLPRRVCCSAPAVCR